MYIRRSLGMKVELTTIELKALELKDINNFNDKKCANIMDTDIKEYNNILNINKQLDTLFIAQENGKFLFDLLAYNANTLSFLGIESKCLNLCTYENKDDFFSYRRTYKQNNIDCGRQISAIMLL